MHATIGSVLATASAMFSFDGVMHALGLFSGGGMGVVVVVACWNGVQVRVSAHLHVALLLTAFSSITQILLQRPWHLQSLVR